ncbi:hypothetical protein SNE25_20995 [Mucilaginibacter sabulilitoris]|uniref:Uncharacterized protein n=1 Tax=Mucilaginibacter sabulilitoris TaxID=1173583 RepID=A0ABZ0TFN0_9SPHI|nr:hypothetical protein [Mucilaginibacter sabulilitoris]WPU91798.1 hypothetical protein SNE25_20995 [Mucilaginibacter sabulilitoris]
MGLHHATLGSAVKKYGPLKPTMSEVALRAEIGKDEKAFDADGIDEILAALPGDYGTDSPDESSEGREGSKDEGEKNPEEEPEVKEPVATKAKKAKGHVVVTEFRDKNNFAKVYKVGEDVSHFDEARKVDLVGRKLIEPK